MPRSKESRNNLSKGWKILNQKWKEPYKDKLDYSRKIIQNSLSRFSNPVICWSGGKDSTIIIHLIKEIFPKIPIINVDIDVEFIETKNFIERLANEWNLNLIRTSSKETNFWEIGERYGWPIFGKNISSNVGRAIRSGNLRHQLSEFEKFLVENNARISNKCAYYLREKPSIKIEKNLNADIKYIGLRAEESRIRSVLWVDYGETYYVKHYFKRNKGIWKSNPICLWTEEDIWRYHKENNIPYCSIYNEGYERNGCWTCCMGVKYGQLKRLRLYDKKLYSHLITKTKMGEEIVRLFYLINQKQGRALPIYSNVSDLIDKYPEFLDGF